ncbi:DUF364 domain-containing protein [Patescibacteria group bacterium]|nr:DUF364 domain-containing protein [Patescibacteria group bacterium]
MALLDALVSSLELDGEVRDIRQGVFHTAVRSRFCGLAATLPRDALRQEPPLVKNPGNLLQKSPGELVQMAYSDSILEAAIGMATINSLLYIDENKCTEINARDLIVEKGKDKRVAIVGHFPFIPMLRNIVEKLWVIEKNPRKGDLAEAEAENFLPLAEIVAITGTAITNHTIDRLLEICDPKAFVIVLGDTAPLSPLLFDFGIDAVAGTKVVDAELVLRCVSEGANFRQIRGTRRLIMLR